MFRYSFCKHLHQPFTSKQIKCYSGTIVLPSITSHELKKNCRHKHDLVFVDTVRKWTSENEEIAKDILTVPAATGEGTEKYGYGSSKTGRCNSTLLDYLKWRKWDSLTRYAVEETEKSEENFKISLALLSHTLTFPLTMASNVHEFIPPSSKSMSESSVSIHVNQEEEGRDEEKNSRTIKLCCVGPRAESTLPLDKWKEFLIFANFKSFTHGEKNGMVEPNTLNNIHWVLDFIGPDVRAVQSQSVSLVDPSSTNYQQQHPENSTNYFHDSLTMNYHSGLLHQYILEKYQSMTHDHVNNEVNNEDGQDKQQKIVTSKLLNHWDGFILFNPGIGHDNLKKSWIPTLKFILKTNKPILTTAHSKLDSDRDLKLWKEIITHDERDDNDVRVEISDQLKYEENPFSSLMSYQDPFTPTEMNNNEVHFVNPNHSVLIIR